MTWSWMALINLVVSEKSLPAFSHAFKVYYYYYYYYYYLSFCWVFTIKYLKQTWLQGIYNVSALLLLQFMVHVLLYPILIGLYFFVSTFWNMCAVSNMAIFCNSMILCFPSMFHRYFLNDFEIVPFAPIITGITFVFIFHMGCIFVVRRFIF
jgi:hypothetical protein